MEFLLLLLAASGLAIQSGPYHLFILVVHLVVAGWIGFRMLGKTPLTGLVTGIYLIFYLPNPIAIHAGWVDLDGFSTLKTLYISNVFILGGLDLFLICGRYFRSKRLTNINQMQPIYIDGYLATWVIVALLCTASGAIFLLQGAGKAAGVNVLVIEKSYRTTSTGLVSLLYTTSTYLSSLVPLAAFLVALKKFQKQIIFLIPIALFVVVYFMIFRVRTPPIAILIAYGVGYGVRNRLVTLGEQQMIRKLPAYIKPGLVIGLLTLVFLGLSIKYIRWSYEVQDMRINEDRIQQLMDEVFAGGDLGYAVFVRAGMEMYPDEAPFLNGQSYYRVLFMPIPRAVWPQKPVSTERIFGAQIDPDGFERGLTLTPGLVGDLYINFGYLGPLGMIGWGLIFSRENYRGLNSLLFLAGSGYWLLHFARGSITSPLATAVFIGLAGFVICRVLRPVPLQLAPADAAQGHA